MDYEYVRADGIGFFIFVVIAIVVNVIKKLASAQSQKPTATESSTGGFKAPQDELNEFLKSIAQAQEPAKPPRPQPPAPRPVSRPPAPRPVAATPPPVATPVNIPEPVAVVAEPVRVATVASVAPVAGHAATPRTSQSRIYTKKAAGRARRNVWGSGDRGLQQAIIAREILGPPIALKSGAQR